MKIMATHLVIIFLIITHTGFSENIISTGNDLYSGTNKSPNLAEALLPEGCPTLSVTENNSNVSTYAAKITVEDNVAPAPTAVCQDITIQLDATGTVTIIPEEIDNGSNDPSGIASLELNKTTFDCTNIGDNTVILTVTATDFTESTCTATVTVQDNINPTAVCKNITVSLDATGNATISGADVDGGSTDNCGIASSAVVPNSFTSADLGANSVTLTVTDDNGKTDNCTATVTIVDSDPPTAVCQNITIQLDGSGNATIDAADIDGGSTDNTGIASLTASQTAFDCSHVGPNSVTLTVEDLDGNTDQCTANVTVQDNINPTAICKNITVSLDATGNATISGADVDGGSTDNCGIASIVVVPNSFTSADLGANSVTLTVTDDNGKTDNCTATVTIVDSDPPTAVCQNITIQLDGSGNATIDAANIDGGSTDNTGIASLTASQTAFDCSHVGSNSVTLTVEDLDGNTDQCTATVTVQDNINPTAVCQNITVSLDATGNATISGADVDGGSTDNCGIASIAVVPNSFTSADLGDNSVTLTVTDNNGNTDNCTATVTIVDSDPPTAVCQNITIQLDGSGNATIDAADIDGGSTDNTGIASLTASQTAFDCSHVGSNSVTLTVEDLDGNTDQCTATVTVQDNINPTAVCQNITVSLDGTGNATISGAAVDGGSTDDCGIASIAVVPNSFTSADLGDNSVTLTVTDNNGNTDNCTATVTIVDSDPPTAVCQNITIQLDGSGNATIGAADIDGGSTDNTGIASLTASQTAFDCSHVGSNSVTLTVEDLDGNTDQCTATVTVQDNINPTAVCQNITVSLDATGNATISGADVDGGSTDNCGIASIAVVPNSFTSADLGDNSVTLTVTDNNGNTDNCTATVTIVDSDPPTAVCQNITIQLDGSGNATIGAADIDGGSTDNTGIASLTASQTAFDCSHVGSNSVTLTVEDLDGNTDQCTATVTVQDNINPTAVCQNITVSLDATGNATISGADVDGGSTDNCGIASIAVVPNSFTSADLGDNSVTLTVTDNNGNTDNCTATVTIVDSDPPTAVCQNITIQLNGSGNATIGAADIDGGSTDNTGIASLTASQTAFDCSHVGSNSVTLTVEDLDGNTDQCTATVTVQDNINPTAVCQNITVSLDATGNATISGAAVDGGSTDNCGIASIAVVPNSFTSADLGDNSVTLTVTDNNGNTDNCTATVTIVDSDPPTAVCQNITIQLDGSGNATIDAADIDGGSTDNTGIASLTASQTAFDCSHVGPNSVKLTVEDLDGNTDQCTATVTVQDNINPTINCSASYTATENSACTGIINVATPDYDDNCGVTGINWTMTGDTNDSGNGAIGTYSFNRGTTTIEYTVADATGNEANCSYQITIPDALSTIASASASVICEGDELILSTNPTGGTPDYTYSWTGPNGFSSIEKNPVISNIATAVSTNYSVEVTDANGCQASASVSVTVRPTPILSVTETDPITCGGDGSLNFTFTEVPDGTYSITYDAGIFSEVIVSGNTATVSAAAGAYNNLTITVNDCTSASDVNASLTDPNPPPAPIVSVQDNCSESVLTASNYTGTLNWSTGETTESITVTTAGTYSVTQTVNGCMSEVASATATPKTIPTLAITATDPTACGENGSLNFTFTDVPDGTYTISYDDGTFDNVVVSSGTASVTAAAGTYNNLQITVNGCTSAPGINASLSDPTPPPAPAISVQDNCGESVITASNYTGTLLWSTGETTESIIVTEAGSYSVTQMLNECISDAASVTAAPKTIPTLAVTKTDPLECGEMGSLNFTFTGVPDGTYSITYDAGTFSGIIVSGNTATVSAGAGAYNNLTITVNDCASPSDVNASLADPNPPPAPTVSVQDNCGESVLTASNYTGTLLWSTGETTESITVTTAGTYSLTQTVNGCMSEVASATATPKTIPTLAITATDPTACGENGSLNFTFTDVPNGNHTITYDDGTFNNVTVSSGTASVTAAAGTYNNLQITVNGCTSDAGINASLAEPTPPPAPTIALQDNCGESVITASDYTGTLLWSTGETTESIIVTEAGSYSVTQMLNECISNAASVTAAPKTVPTLAVTKTDPLECGEMGSLNFTFTGVPDGTYSITYDAGTFSGVIVSGNTATVSAAAGAYNNLTITVNDCASASDVNISLADPNPPPAPTVSVQDNCGESVLTASNYTGTLLWSNGETTESITVTTASTYSVTQTVNGCMSEVASATATPKTIPTLAITATDPTACGENGSLDFTFTNVPDGSYTISYEDGTFNNVTVSSGTAAVAATAGTYNNLQITVNGCTSDAGINASLAKPTPPPAPAISVQDNCGESVITASNYTGTLLWSTGETTESITVTEAGSYSVTQMLNECISDAASVTAAPKTVPTLAVTKTDPLVCGEMGSLNFTFTDVPDGTYSITYDAGIFSEVIVSGNTATVSAAAGAYNNLTITVNDCASASDVNASLADPNPPPAPTISVQDNCGESVLTASNYTGTLLWSTGETTESITVTTAGTYSVTQTVNGCMSDAASILATPQNGTLLPEIEVVNNCGESTITMQNLEENAWFVWKFNNQTDSTENSSIKVSEEGEYTIWQKNNNCKSLESTVTVTPYAIPSLPVANNQTSIVTDADSIIPLTAEAISDPNAVIVWFENDSGGEEITSPVLDTIGTVTYFAEALNTTTGCISPGRTPVTLTIRMDTDTITIDTTIIGKPHTNVAVLIFATDSLQYQWYMNDEKLLNATNQFYYIFESDRQNGNIFTIEVTFPDGHSSKFNYYYTGNQSSGTIDADNKSGITETETVFSIFPNPASTSFTLAIDTRQIQNIQNLTAKVFSISGVCTIEVPITQIPQRIDTKDLRPGIYSVILYNNGQWLQAKKLSITQN